MRKLYATLALALAFVMPGVVRANNVVITGTSFNDATDVLSFTLSWQNSWRISAGPANWDAVWIFIKYQNCPALEWNHLNLSAAGHSTSAPALLGVQTVSDNIGVFVRRVANGSGDIPATTINLQTPNTAGNGNWNFRVFGIEMVYVPQGDFQIGSTGAPSTFTEQTITSDGQINAGVLYGGSTMIPTNYPAGWSGFYIMKYEVSAEMYANYLNTLTYDQQVTRVAPVNPNDPVGTVILQTPAAAVRVRIEIMQQGVNNTTPAVFACDLNNNNSFNEPNDGQWVPITAISWDDHLAFMDWSGLRPMSELEYEKACRGTLARVALEYAWGNTTFTNPGGLTNPNTATESIATVVGPAGTTSSSAPLWRNGAPATASTNRTTAGATYYGVMEMSGNTSELAVAAPASANVPTVIFEGSHGNGVLDAAGSHVDNNDWPVANFTWGQRGGAHNLPIAQARISDRTNASANIARNTRNASYGLRGVRTQTP
ncbi:MAG: SUMF1/EgtB/PvdO family nonheme iron enzyme [Bacteroidetes bacterium]|nr:SUMF1/EgtB/PvdO family nonheme iron enzyme [Bacteroidota bacterium]